MNTKRNSMKLKMALCALSLLSAPAIIRADNYFINTIINEVKAAFNGIDKLYDNVVKPSKLTFDQCVKETGITLQHMKENVLNPLQAEACASGKSKTEQDTIRLAHEIVTEIYTRFSKVHKVLEDHAKSPKKNNPIVLAAPLQEQLKPLLDPANLKKLKEKLTELHDLLVKVDATTAVKEIKEVIAAVDKAIKKSGEASKEMKAKLLAALKDLLSRK